MSRPESGAALIEFALVMPIFLVLTVAAVDFGRAFHVKNVLERAAREGARLRAVSGDTAQVRVQVLAITSAADVEVSGLVIDGPFPDFSVHVAVTGDFHWLFPGVFALLGGRYANPTPVTAHAYMRNQGAS